MNSGATSTETPVARVGSPPPPPPPFTSGPSASAAVRGNAAPQAADQRALSVAAHASPYAGRVVRRFYWRASSTSVVAAHAQPSDAAMLADARLAPVWRSMRAARPHDVLRVACVVHLEDKTPVQHLLEARTALARFGILLDIWPQLVDGGSWRSRLLNTSTAAVFQARLLPLLDELARRGGPTDVGLALDVEPVDDLMDGLWGVAASRTLMARMQAAGSVARGMARTLVHARQGRRDLTELARDLAARDMAVHAAVLPPVGTTSPAGDDTWRTWLLGCPIVDVDGQPLFRTQAALCYAPMMRVVPEAAWRRATARAPQSATVWSSMSQGARVSERERERYTLALWAARHRAHFDAVVLGPTSRGAAGDRPIYEDAQVLAEDVRAMDALGFTDVGVHDLVGLLFGPDATEPGQLPLRPDMERWLSAAVGET